MASSAHRTLRTCAALLCVTLSLAACGSKGTTPASPDAPAATPTTTTAAPATEQPAEAPKYAVTIDGAEQTTDYSGNPALVVTYTFTNNSDEATAMLTALRAEAYQDGVQCDIAFVKGVGGDSMTKVKPGGSTQVRSAYALKGASPVEIEVTELFSFDKTILAQTTINLA